MTFVKILNLQTIQHRIALWGGFLLTSLDVRNK
jgi:hypothetical protein